MALSADNLAEHAARAAQWRLASALVGAVARFGIGVILARLLPPVDFGIVALALVVTGFAQPLGDLGIASAVVQRRDLTPRHIRVAFTFSVFTGVLIATTLILAAPLAAVLARDARVVPILRVVSLGFALQGFSVVAAGLLRRRLDFRRLFYIDTLSYILGYGVVAVTLALAGKGVWSLAWGSLVQTLMSTVLQVLVTRHPVRPLLAGHELTGLLHYGVGAGANSTVNYLALNADNFIVGRLLGATSLGLYGRAYNLMNLPYTYAASVMSGVLFPAFARIQEDMPRLRRGYLTMTKLTAVVAGPSMCALGIVAPFLVPALYGPQWTGVVVPLQILCVAGYFRALYHVGGVVAQSVGRVYSELWLQVCYAALVVIGATVGSAFKLPGVAVGVGIAIIFMFVATARLVLSITQTSWLDYLYVQRGAALISAAVLACGIVAQASLRASGQRDGVVVLGIVLAAGLPSSVGLLWTLGAPDLRNVALRLPRPVQQLVHSIRRASALNPDCRA